MFDPTLANDPPPALPCLAKLLVIEHKPEDIRTLLDTLNQAQFHITVAFDGFQGYARASTLLPDLILLDAQLERMDGVATYRLLKEDPVTTAIPVIFMSSSKNIEDMLSALDSGAVDFIQKPFEALEVLARVKVQLRLQGAIRDRDKILPRVDLDRTQPTDHYLVRAAVGHIASNLSNLPNVPELARRVGTHSKRLTRAFREQYGMSLAEYVRVERVLLARRLLTQTPMSVQEICTDTGFSSAANFATAFKDAVGVSPTSFRRRVMRSRTLGPPGIAELESGIEPGPTPVWPSTVDD